MANSNTNPINDVEREMLRIGATLQNGKYRIDRYLASGGFGNTYLSVNVSLQKPMVVKEFFLKGITGRDPKDCCSVTITLQSNKDLFNSQLRKFEREARRLFDLNHANIVRVHDLFQENGTAYYVMDFIDGESLGQKVKRDGPMSEGQVMNILPQLLSALDEVHHKGLFHLDLKPGNVMMDRNGVVRLIDFGASKQMGADGAATTTTGMAYTPGFAAPEQVHGQLDRVSAWTDIYALGATLYYLLTAQTPPNAIDIDYSPDEAFRFTSSVSPAMCGFIKWLMQPNYRKRPQMIDEVVKYMPGTQQPINQQPQSSYMSDELTQPAPALQRPSIQEATIASVKRPSLVSNINEETVVSQPETIESPADYTANKKGNKRGLIYALIASAAVLLLIIGFFAYNSLSGNNSVSGSEYAEESSSDVLTSFSVQNGISSTTGSKNCFLPELGAPIKFDVADNGANADLTAKVTIKHSDKTEFEEMTEPAKLWISGREDANKDVKLTLTADEDSQKKLAEWLKAAPGTELEVVFKGTVPKADMKKLNGKESDNTLVF